LVHQTKQEGQIQLQRAIIEERQKHEIALQNAITRTRNEMAEKEGAITVVTYEGWPGQQQTMQGHIPNIMVATEAEGEVKH